MYLLDANVFITAKNSYYAFDIAPGYWDWIEKSNESGLVFTVDAVVDELTSAKDELSTWVTRMKPSLSKSPGIGTQPHLTATADWAATCGRFTVNAIAEFLSVADYYLVAQARELGFVVVTHELSDPNAKKRIKIPDACLAMGVAYSSLWQLLRSEQIKLVL